jgi:hypothetical protein
MSFLQEASLGTIGETRMKLDEPAVLATIAEHLECRDQWLESGHLASAMEYEFKAEGLIELLEVVNCGSIGGFDKGQPDARVVKDSTRERFNWLKRKYSTLKIVNGRVVSKPA